jgi:lipopolysaccharide transport system ATP-binding protein
MGESAIRVEQLGKSYRIAPAGAGYRTLRDDVVAWMKNPVRRAAREEFWALKDVTFEVKRGDVLGVIGRNGAGKSTLLKILSRITKPTTGSADIFGRVGSLLEVGTGFHPELSGRENIFLNGAILGMTRRDIVRKFDEIVAFAEVEQFLETPVKRYSSGMYMRLAFAVAAHLEPDILVVDEVLAVGDAKFQEKSLGKMSDVAREGRTVLFVSHNMAAVNRLCKQAMLLNQGCIVAHGDAQQVVAFYHQSGIGATAQKHWSFEEQLSYQSVKPVSVCIKNAADVVTETFKVSDTIRIELVYEVETNEDIIVPVLRLYNANGVVFTSFDSDLASYTTIRQRGQYRTRMTIPPHLLNEGAHSVLLSINVGRPLESHVYVPDVAAFQVVEDDEVIFVRQYYPDSIPGTVRPFLHWETQEVLQEDDI